MSSTVSAPTGSAKAPRRKTLLRAMLADRGVVVSAVTVLVLALLALLAPLLFPGSNTINAADRLMAPSPQHWFGTDELGRDLLARISQAGQLTLVIALGAMVLSIILGVVWGMLAASFGGWIEEVLMRTADAIMAVPMILFALVFVAALGSSPETLVVILGIIKAPLVARVTRSATLVELTSDYVRGLTVLGLTKRKALFTEILPNVFPVIASVATLNIASAIMIEASLSFIGLGVQPPLASWGTLLKIGYGYLHEAWWYAFFPAVAITVLIAAFNTIGRQFQRYLDKRAV